MIMSALFALNVVPIEEEFKIASKELEGALHAYDAKKNHPSFIIFMT